MSDLSRCPECTGPVTKKMVRKGYLRMAVYICFHCRKNFRVEGTTIFEV